MFYLFEERKMNNYTSIFFFLKMKEKKAEKKFGYLR